MFGASGEDVVVPRAFKLLKELEKLVVNVTVIAPTTGTKPMSPSACTPTLTCSLPTTQRSRP